MKKIVVALVIFAVILTLGILENMYIDKVFDQLDKRLFEIENALHNEDEIALALTKDLSLWWENKRKSVELFTFSPDIRAFSVALAEQEGSLECGDFVNAMSKCQSLISLSHNMHQILDFNIEDII